MTRFATNGLLAFDLGAESGRAVIGRFEEGGRLTLEEVHRFVNGPVRVMDSLHWDILRLWKEIQNGLALAAHKSTVPLASLGLDTWGVDFGLLDANDALLGNPYHYRDSRTDRMMERAFQIVPRAEIYERTGLQFLQFNSLFQLLAMAETKSPALREAKAFLMIPDLLNFWLTGRKANEFTITTTSQCFDPRSGAWATDLVKEFGIPGDIFGEVLMPGSILGGLRAAVAEDAGIRTGSLSVVLPATHDTGSAVAAVPAQTKDFIYLSSGTWSLMGVEIPHPIITAQSLAADMTNEGGVNGSYRFLRNIMGLWLIQECRRGWEKEGQSYSYDQLTHMAQEAPAFGPLINPADHRFLAPGDMPGRIQGFCRDTGQRVPSSKGEILRCALESLAFEYRRVAESLDQLVGYRLPVIHIIGGGSRNQLLNQMTADAAGRTVVAGPVEATAIGNVLVQALSLGYITDLADGRRIVSQSFQMETYEPVRGKWDEEYRRYLSLLGA